MTAGMKDYSTIIRPKYGGARSERGAVVVDADDWTELLAIGGKGMVYGGLVFLDYTSTQRDSVIKLEYDGRLTANKSFGVLNRYNLTEPRACPLFLLKFDDVGFIYTVGFAYGLTFESGVKVKYFEGHGTTPNVNYSLIYARL